MSELDANVNDEIADGERWLAGFQTPEPSRECVQRVKAAVRSEVGRAGPRDAAGRWVWWHGALSAAASIALAVTVGWHSTRHHCSVPAGLAQGDAMSAWSDETWQDAVALGDLEDELSDLETWTSDDAWDADGAVLYEALDGVLQEVVDGDDDLGASIGRSPLGRIEEV